MRVLLLPLLLECSSALDGLMAGCSSDKTDRGRQADHAQPHVAATTDGLATGAPLIGHHHACSKQGHTHVHACRESVADADCRGRDHVVESSGGTHHRAGLRVIKQSTWDVVPRRPHAHTLHTTSPHLTTRSCVAFLHAGSWQCMCVCVCARASCCVVPHGCGCVAWVSKCEKEVEQRSVCALGATHAVQRGPPAMGCPARGACTRGVWPRRRGGRR